MTEILSRKRNVGTFANTWFQIISRTVITKSEWYWHQSRNVNQCKKKNRKPEVHPQRYNYFNLDKLSKKIYWRHRKVSSTHGAYETGFPHVRPWNWGHSSRPAQKPIKNRSKLEILKGLEKNSKNTWYQHRQRFSEKSNSTENSPQIETWWIQIYTAEEITSWVKKKKTHYQLYSKQRVNTNGIWKIIKQNPQAQFTQPTNGLMN